MNTNIFIDGKKLFKTTTIVACVTLLLIALGVFVFIKFDFFASFRSLLNFPFVKFSSIAKVCGSIGYMFLMAKFVQLLIPQYSLAFQKEPFMQISNTGLLFNQRSKVTSIPWNQVVDVKLAPASRGLIIDFTQEAEIENQLPFTKLGSLVAAVTISYPKISPEEVCGLVLKHKDKFGQRPELLNN